MNQTTISAGQSLFDVAVQELGSVEGAFDLADASGLAITDLLTPGQVLEVPGSAVARPELVSYFLNRGQRINTGDVAAPAPPAPAAGYFSFQFFNPDYYA